MKVNFFESFATELVGKKVEILEPDAPNKYANYSRLNKDIQPSTKYGIYFDGYIQYDFKTTKKIDTFLKTFVNQHINKYELKKAVGFENGSFVYPTKKDVIKKYKDQNRVNKYCFYTTLYGIGMFAFFTSDIKESTKKLTEYLQKNKITFYNEFSDAGWAYRFVINKDVKKHNELLENFNK